MDGFVHSAHLNLLDSVLGFVRVKTQSVSERISEALSMGLQRREHHVHASGLSDGLALSLKRKICLAFIEIHQIMYAHVALKRNCLMGQERKRRVEIWKCFLVLSDAVIKTL